MRQIPTLGAALALAFTASAPAEAAKFYAAADGDVIAYFAGTSASFSESLGLLINGTPTGVIGLNNQTSVYGESINLGTASLGDELTFFIEVYTTGDTFYSDIALNADGVEHIVTSPFAGDDTIPAGVFVGFEDLYGGGDFNYNDLKFVFSNVVAVPDAVPEPASWAMMIAGFGLIGDTLRRRHRRTVRFAAAI
jgi:hypothetical protein